MSLKEIASELEAVGVGYRVVTAAARADSPHRQVTLASHEAATSILRSRFGAKKVQTELRKVLARTLTGVTLTVSKPRGAGSLQIKLSRHGVGANSSSAVLDTLGPDYLVVSVDGKPPRRIDDSVAIVGAVRLAISLLK